MAASNLTAAEILVLLNPNKTQGREAFKLSLMELLARGVIDLRKEEIKGFWGRTQTIDHIRITPGALGQSSVKPHLHLILGLLSRDPSGPGLTMKNLIQAAGVKFGNDFGGFQKDRLLPELVEQGLLEARQEKALWVFPVTRYRLTQKGEAIKQQLEDQIERARSIPDMIGTNPAQTAALILGLGSAILLVDEAKSHYAQLSRIMREQQSGGNAPSDYYVPGAVFDPSSDMATLDTSELRESIGNFFDFDLDINFDGFDSILDSFESSFDSSAGGNFGADAGDGGGDGGGGGE